MNEKHAAVSVAGSVESGQQLVFAGNGIDDVDGVVAGFAAAIAMARKSKLEGRLLAYLGRAVWQAFERR
jgi:hypothetical protein